jgi:hypothetical protein
MSLDELTRLDRHWRTLAPHKPKEAMNLDDFSAGIAVMRAAIEKAIQ